MLILRFPLALSVALVISFAAGAEDGQLEINQTCAVDGGCFAGDDPGFPVQIETAGSYLLTSNLDVTVASDPPNTTAIAVNEDHVALDLNGFRILGPALCSNIPVTSCSNSGSGDGINGRFYTTIRNGSIRGMGNDGINTGTGSRVIGVSAFGNAGVGISGVARIVVVEVASDRNGADGVNVNSDSVLRDVRASGNAQAGISADSGSVVTNSTVENNGAQGAFLADGGTIEASSVRGNQGLGISLRDAHAAGNTISGNTGFGIECNSGGVSVVRGNTFIGNNGTGLEFNADCTPVSENVCDGVAC